MSPYYIGGLMKNIEIDIETYSSIDLKKSGVYKYVEANDFEILLFAYSIDGGDVKVIDLIQGEKIPDEIINALQDNNVTKWAFNAQFERICLSRFLGMKTGEYLNPTSWKCSMIWSAYMGLPLSLEGVGTVLGLEKQKLLEGKELIRYFCVPCLPTKTNGERTRNLPKHDIEKWKRFKEYNIRDVEVEKQIQSKLNKFPVPENVWEEYYLDQEINDRGILIDKNLVDNAIRIDSIIKKKLLLELQNLTQIENPNSVIQMKEWLKQNEVEVETLDKKGIEKLLKEVPNDVYKILMLRKQLAKSSVKKYTAMINAACSDNRCRGMFQFYGANRTGRFAGRIVQLQNLPQNHMSDLENARELINQDNLEALEMLYEDIPDTLSQLIRTAFIPCENNKFYVADFSAIEARVIAWLSNEKWRNDVFENGGDIYCASASQMFNVPVEKHGVNGHLRQKGKIAELALGYGGSVGALKAMGALEMGINEEELKPLVDAWRKSNPNIVKLWWDVDRVVKNVVKNKTIEECYGIKFYYKSGMLFIILPSGRQLTYVKPRIEVNQFGSEFITYEGVGSTKKWERIESYGPKFVENIVQGIARDILMNSIKTLSMCNIVAHVHDEIIIEATPKVSLDELCKFMARVPKWAEGLKLCADGYVCDFYMKD